MYHSRLVLAWAELHQEDLMADWDLLMNGEQPFKIPTAIMRFML
jgi:hypothetical protein